MRRRLDHNHDPLEDNLKDHVTALRGHA